MLNVCHVCNACKHSLRGSSVKIGTIQRILALPLRKMCVMPVMYVMHDLVAFKSAKREGHVLTPFLGGSQCQHYIGNMNNKQPGIHK